MEYKDYYATLGVPQDADPKKIRDAFRKLARKYHPDVNPGDKQSEAKFKEINEAYEVLSNPDKRRKYDQLGANWEQIERDEELRRKYAAEAGAAGGPGAADFSDFFSAFFGGARGRGGGGGFADDFGAFFGGEAPVAGAHVEVEVPITLGEAARGTTRRLDLQVADVCTTCQGSGIVAAQARSVGQKRVAYDARPCTTCQGTGTVPGRRTVDVRIPAGITEGLRLRVAGQGGSGPRGAKGDLYVRVRFQPHPVFTPDGRNLRGELPVWDFEAALGAEVDAPTLDGRVRVHIPAGSQGGQTLRLRGKGLPGAREQAPGDLLYTLRIVVPSPLQSEEKELLTKLRDRVAAHSPNPRDALFRDVG